MPDGTPSSGFKQMLTRGMAYLEPGETAHAGGDGGAGGALRGHSFDGDAGFRIRLSILRCRLPSSGLRSAATIEFLHAGGRYRCDG